jgi:hypothetical protein
MTDDVEARLAERGLAIEQFDDFRSAAPPTAVGFVGVLPADPGIRAVAYVAPDTDTDSEQRAVFARWVELKVDNYLECGPMRDGWEKRSDEGWQLWAREDDLENLESAGGMANPHGF